MRKRNGILLTFLLAMQPANAAAPGWQENMAEGNRLLAWQRLPAAQTCFEAALEAVRRDRSAKPLDRAACMQALADVLHRQNFIEDVIPLDRQSLQILQRAYGKQSVKVVPALILLGDVFESEGQYKKAVKFYERALAAAKSDAGPDSLIYADCAHLLGRASFKAGLAAQGDENYRESLAVLMKQSELPDSKLLQELLSDYIDLLRKVGGLGKVLSSDFNKELLQDRIGALPRTRGVEQSHWQKAVSARLSPGGETQIFGEGATPPAFTISPDQPMSDFVALEQINKQRVDFYERMIAVDIDTLGADHPSVARDIGGLAAIYLSQRKYEQAKPLLERALAIYKNVYGSDAQVVGRTQALLDLIAAEQNTKPETDAALVDYVSSLPAIPLSAQKLEVALNLNSLAFVLYCQGKIEQARTVYALALSDTARSCGNESMLSAACMTDYAGVLRSAGQSADAARFDDLAHSILRRNMARQSARAFP